MIILVLMKDYFSILRLKCRAFIKKCKEYLMMLNIH